MKWIIPLPRPKTEATFYGVTRDGTLTLDTRGLLVSGRMARQLSVARELGRKCGAILVKRPTP